MKLQSALDMAARGFKVFPLVANTKLPPKDFPWKENATTDEATIRGWWGEDPDYNIGVATGAGVVVIDADTAKGRPGLGSLDMLDMLGLPGSLRVATPSGGVHVYLKTERQFANRVDTIADYPGLDLRGENGYVLAPGSTIDGRPYRAVGETDVVSHAPQWVEDAIARSAAEHRMSASEQPLVELDLPEHVTKATAWLRDSAQEAVDGAGGDQSTYEVACRLRDLGISEPLALELMIEHWNEAKASPPWQPDDLATKVANAYRYSTGGWGAGTAAGEFGVVDIDIGEAPQTTSKTEGVDNKPATPLATVRASAFAPLDKPERRFVVADLVPDRNVTILNGDGATGKSLLAMQLGVAMAADRRWIGLEVEHGPVLYLAAEDDADENHIRVKDICDGEGIDLAALDDLHIAVMAGEDCLLAVESEKSAAVLRKTALFQKLRATVASIRPRLLVLDNLADIFGGNENVKSLARQFIGMLRGLAIEFDCAVLLLAHPSLSGMASGSGSSGNVAWNNSVRSRLYLQRDKGDDGVELDPNRRFLETKKANYAGIGTQIDMRWERGRFVALDMPELDDAEDLTPAEQKAEKARRVFLDMVERFNAQGRRIAPTKGANYAPSLFARHSGAGHLGQTRLEAAMNELFDSGEIEVQEVGPPSKRRQNIVLARHFD